MTENELKPRQRAPGAGRKPLPESSRKRRVELYLNPALAAYLEAEDQPEEGRHAVKLRRKREAADLLLQANIESRII